MDLLVRGKRTGSPKKGGGAKKAAGIAFAAALAAGVAWCACAGWRNLARKACEPGLITDQSRQVRVMYGSFKEGRFLRRGTIVEFLGLTNGANMATADFAGRRLEMLDRFPVLKNLAVRRNLAERTVEVDVTERMPVARIGLERYSPAVDEEGVVFPAGLGLDLPSIILPRGAAPKPGGRLSGRAAAALQLVTVAKTAAPEIPVRAVDARRADFLLVTFGGYCTRQAQIKWEGMDNPSAATAAEIGKRLAGLSDAFKSGLCDDADIWYATDPDPRRISARP